MLFLGDLTNSHSLKLVFKAKKYKINTWFKSHSNNLQYN